MSVPRLTNASRTVPLERDLRRSYDLSLLKLLRTLYRRRLMFVSILAGVLALAILAGLILPKRYTASALIQLGFGETAPESVPGAGAGGPSIALDAAALVKGETEILASRAIARRVLDANAVANMFARSRSRLGQDPVVALEKPLEVLNDGKSYLITVRYEAGDPEVAATIANAFADAYLANRADEGVTASRTRSLWLADQVAEAERTTEEAGRTLQAFAETSGIVVSTAGSPSAADQQMRALLEQLSARQASLRDKQLRLDRLAEAAAAGRMPLLADLEGAESARRAVDAEMTAARDLASLGATLGTLHPRYRQARSALDALEARRNETVKQAVALARTDLSSARRDETALLGEVAKMQRRVVTDSTDLQRALALQASWQTAITERDLLRASLRQAQAIGDFKPVAATLVSPAEPMAEPVSLRLLSAGVIGVFGGVFVALGSIFLLESRDAGYAEVGPAQDGLGLPCVGVIPALSKTKKQAGHSARVRNAALQTMVARLGLTEQVGDKRIVVVGSALAGEGKTALIHDMAAIIADAGRRVVVVESSPKDERAALSTRWRSWNGEMSRGLRVTAVAERSKGGHLAMHAYQRQLDDQTPVFEGQDQFIAWLNGCVDQFDLVLVEAPALLLDGRAMVLARVADLFILSVAWRSTTRASLGTAVEQLAAMAHPPRAIAFAFTEVETKSHDAYGPADTLYFQNRHLRPARAAIAHGAEAGAA
ncbi:Wzz/FepE/Etk N-terminal domain-containing protein [Fulvimarina sp. 2208YS6-2-32]|uniref:Wzz/FepE/Etk N-terminal domain-containing protein n=1 Tax=Fulvimarina uroteuthidis TaxID=3098149 RepID=A0ABU5I0Y9_9HYPH|nr:Wzz/FepE/Etk N-terminal domain-containing protein [Fulvimarina sp. 2208YS6-2-32]MDY8108792.1 Wzz/FepE/Etk N-terminal domain-containing protein [Fulvimarina sp. 2208YS6-2-32]